MADTAGDVPGTEPSAAEPTALPAEPTTNVPEAQEGSAQQEQAAADPVSAGDPAEPTAANDQQAAPDPSPSTIPSAIATEADHTAASAPGTAGSVTAQGPDTALAPQSAALAQHEPAEASDAAPSAPPSVADASGVLSTDGHGLPSGGAAPPAPAAPNTAARASPAAAPAASTASPSSRPTTATTTPVPTLHTEAVQPGGAGSQSGTPRSARGTKLTTAPSVYDPSQFIQEVDPAVQLPASAAPTVHLVSLDALRRNNLAYIEDDVLVMAAGNQVVFLQLSTMTQTYLQGLDGGSIGAVAVHPNRRFLAVAEKCRHRAPNIYVYAYPSLALVKVMHDGTEHAYSALAFNETGEQLASVGSWPDYLLTLWRWEQEAIVLRSKAFSQEVYSVRFSPYFAGNMTTCGTGHIRFWKMASTFTGLKLQGQIGKFGAVELSDVAAFVELPDGKVLSGTETGELLLWDGGLIKVVLTRSNHRPCHDGQVNILLHDRGSNTILSAGGDGYVRLWDFTRVSEAEAEEDSHSLAIAPVDEVQVSSGTAVHSLLWERRHWLAVDGQGNLLRVALPQSGLPSKGATTTKLLSFHAGGVVGLALSPAAHVALTASRDGSVRTYDYASRQPKAALQFKQAATCLEPVGAAVHAAAVGFRDGVLRLVVRLQGELRLMAALKPHKGGVTALAVSADGTQLVTGGQDSTLFFFSCDPSTWALTPLCFVKVPAVPRCASWAADGSTLLVGLTNGTVLEVDAPDPQSLDTHKTMQVTLNVREYPFKLPKPRKKIKRRKGEAGAATGADGAPLEGEAAAPTEPATPATDSQPGTDGQADGGTEDFEEVEVIDEAAAEAQDLQELSVETVSYLPGAPGRTSHILITLTGPAVGNVWKFDLTDLAAEPTSFCAAPPTAPTSLVTHSACGRLRLLGTADGVVRIQRLAEPYGAADGPYWQASLHDVQRGRVTSAAASFDRAYLLSAAQDGTICLQTLTLEGFSPESPKPSGIEHLLTPDQAQPPADDITNPQEYTLEEAKQKAEQDALEAAAEAKKMGVREQLAQIRAEFEALMAENEARPEHERLPRTAFEIDEGLRDMVAEETALREEAARSELAWETEKHRLALEKLKAFFLDNVEVERIVLRALGSQQYVTSFRTPCMSMEVLDELLEAKQAEEERLEAIERRKALSPTPDHAADSSAILGSGLSATQSKSGDIMATGQSEMAHTSKADMRRAARKQREAAWAAFNATRPDEKYEDPADVAAIEFAEQNMGDFKLKSDPAYVVPEDARMTPQRKRYQSLLLQEAMYDARMAFNERFLALREVKKKVVAEVNDRIAQIRSIDVLLGGSAEEEASTPLKPLAMQPDEMPEDREKVTDADIEEFLRAREEEARKAAEGSALGGFATGASKPAAAAAAGGQRGTTGGKAGGDSGKAAPPPASETSAAQAGAAATAAAVSDDALSRMMAAVPLTDLERQLQAWHRRRLSQQRARLRAEVREMCMSFDAALTTLRREKFRLEKELKMCELRQLVYAQELTLLLDFDKREVVLIQKRSARIDDRNELVDKIAECSSKLEAKKKELEGLMGRRTAVAAEFDNMVPESDPFREALSKVFYRRIKRAKKATGDGEDSEEDEDDDEDGEDGDDSDDDDGGPEVCPPGCDQGLYEKVCDLRERRLDEEEHASEFTKAIEGMRKDREGLAKKQRLLEQALTALNGEIAAFQQEKQAALNQVEVVVHLHMHQIEYLADGKLPEDLSAALVFSSKQLERLRHRIDELEEEKNALRHRHKTLKKEHQQLLKDKAEKEARVAELEARAYDVQMLKFGQQVDLELLDGLGAATGTEELRAELARQEAAHAREVAVWDAKIAERTDELMALTRENTAALNAVSSLTSAQRKVEAGLSVARKTMFADPVSQRRKEVEERDGLVQLINAQAKELESLKAQVIALRRKDTSVYT